jgi:hypothetical protein
MIANHCEKLAARLVPKYGKVSLWLLNSTERRYFDSAPNWMLSPRRDGFVPRSV